MYRRTKHYQVKNFGNTENVQKPESKIAADLKLLTNSNKINIKFFFIYYMLLIILMIVN